MLPSSNAFGKTVECGQNLAHLNATKIFLLCRKHRLTHSATLKDNSFIKEGGGVFGAVVGQS